MNTSVFFKLDYCFIISINIANALIEFSTLFRILLIFIRSVHQYVKNSLLYLLASSFFFLWCVQFEDKF